MNPTMIAYDNNGSMWVADYGQINMITKINVSTGTMVNYTSNLLNAPIGIAFDGVSMWVSNQIGFNVTKVNLSSMVMTNYAGTCATPWGIAYDNNGSMWVANYGTENVTKVNITNGAMKNYTGTGVHPETIAYDGNGNMWVQNAGSNLTTKVISSTGAMTNYSGTGGNSVGIASDSNYLSCSPVLNSNWYINTTQICSGINVTTGTGMINITKGGTLTLLKGANVSTKGLNLNLAGDSVFILNKSNLIL